MPVRENVRVDGDRLGALICRLDPRDAEDMVGRAVEELAIRLSRCEAAARDGDPVALRPHVESLTGLSGQLGMTALARAARQVICCIDAGDPTATAATTARLVRVADQSLHAVWDIGGLSV